MLREWAMVDPWWGTVVPEILEVDILRGRAGDDLLSPSRQEELQKQIDTGDWDWVIATPPCSGFSRPLF